VVGDIRQPRLGLERAAYHALADQVDWVIHAAAVTDFAQPWEELWQCNVEGTRHLLAFAAQAKARVIYVSTAFVHPRPGHCFNRYERSKRMAETLVRQSNVPTTIVRPSIIVGDSQTGISCKQQGIHRVINLLLKGILPAVPGSPRSLLDIVPQDRIADAIVGVLRNELIGTEYWLTAGADALPLDQGLEMVMARAEGLLGKRATKPLLVDPDDFAALLQQHILPTLPAPERQRFETALSLFPFMDMGAVFPSSFAQLGQEVGLAALPDPQVTFARNLDYVVQYNVMRAEGAPA
jgi:nucleoside-diphosphate-sugar epimerase